MQIVSTTVSERSTQIVDAHVPRHIIAIDRDRLAEDIRKLAVENASAEVERRRAAENMLGSCKGGVMVVCSEEVTTLLAWNPRTKRWYESPMSEKAS